MQEEGLPELAPGEMERLRRAMLRMMELGVAAVYGDEPGDLPDAAPDCAGRLPGCGARCCTLTFALTRAEAGAGHIRHNPARPFFIARDADGYCPHLDRATYRCLVYENRPLRCRRYDCETDTAEVE